MTEAASIKTGIELGTGGQRWWTTASTEQTLP